MNSTSKINSSNNMFDETQFSFFNNKNNDTSDDQNNEKKYKEQVNILNKNNKLVPDNYNLPYEKMHTATPGLFGQRHTPDYNNIQNRKNDKYDHLGDYYYKKGDRNYSSITRYYTYYLNIDSRLRNITPVYTNLDYINLRENPLQLTYDSNELFIKTNDLIKLNVNDKISLSGLYNTSKNLKVDSDFFEFTINSYYVKVNYPHTLYFEDLAHVKNYSNTDLYVEFLDITKNVNPESNFINNIPVNTLNLIQKVYLYNPDNEDFSNDYFFIKLVKPFNGNNYENFTFKLVYLYTYGIANNKINSQYPINAHNNQGYLLVKKIKPDGIIVELSKKANFRYNELGNIINYGGNNISISKINELIKGYPIPNEYHVDLDRTFNNVIMIKLISSEFPVLNKLVYECKNDTELNMNNKLYWQNYEDHEIIYSVSISQGNYTMEQLISLIENKVLEVQRQTTVELFGNYNKKNIIKIDYYEGNNEIKFYSFKEAELIDPFKEVIEVDDAIGDYKIKIYHQNHNLLNADKIIISNASSYGGFSETVINGTFYIDEIIDSDNYYIYLTNVNRYENYYIAPSGEQNGGNAVNILVENIFRLMFNYNDTLGAFFGFRYLGEKKSVTKFASVISNKYLYQGEFLDQSLICMSENNETVLRSITLEDQNYIYMTCVAPNVETNIINQMITFSKIKNVFSKIQIHYDTNIVNNMVYNSFTCNPSYIHNPIPELKELYFKFYDKYGNLLEYSDFEHSFTLEITTLGEIPEGTNLSYKYPKVN
jgi:hypothetical protein